MYCHNCGALVEEGSVYCSGCGEKMNGEETSKVKKRKKAKLYIGIILAMVGILLLSGGYIFWSNSERVLFAVCKDGWWGFADKTGKMVVPAKFDSIYSNDGIHSQSSSTFVLKRDEAVIVSSNDKYGYVDANGEEVIPTQYDWLGKFSKNDLIPFTNYLHGDGYWELTSGYLDDAGTLVIKAQYERARNFTSNNMAAASVEDKWGFINERGMFVIQPGYDYVGDFAANGLARAEKNDKWGYINEQGKQ